MKLFISAIKSTLYNYLEAADRGANTTPAAAKYLHKSVITTRAQFSALRKKGFLKAKLRGQRKLYSLSKKGKAAKAFYDELKKMNETKLRQPIVTVLGH
ncbi:MAG: hypothetical protein AB1626_04545 [Candidatus Micrarchaeota archaeon]